MTGEIYYKNIDEFAYALSESKYGESGVTIIGKYNSIRAIVESLIRDGYGLSGATDFYDDFISGYKDEYIASILDEEIFIEPIRVGEEYVLVFDDIVYVLADEVNVKALKKTSAEKMYLVYVGDYYKCEESAQKESCCKCGKKTCDNKTADNKKSTNDNNGDAKKKYTVDEFSDIIFNGLTANIFADLLSSCVTYAHF